MVVGLQCPEIAPYHYKTPYLGDGDIGSVELISRRVFDKRVLSQASKTLPDELKVRFRSLLVRFNYWKGIYA